MFKVLGIGLMLIAIALVAVPMFTDCQARGEASQLTSGEMIPMKCHWSGLAEIGVAIPMYVIGAVMTTSRRRHTLSLLSLLAVVLGGMAIAFPTKLIGVCPSPMMLCSSVMRPALVLLGGGAIGLSGTGLVLSRTAKGLTRGSTFTGTALSKIAAVWKGAL